MKPERRIVAGGGDCGRHGISFLPSSASKGKLDQPDLRRVGLALYEGALYERLDFGADWLRYTSLRLGDLR